VLLSLIPVGAAFPGTLEVSPTHLGDLEAVLGDDCVQVLCSLSPLPAGDRVKLVALLLLVYLEQTPSNVSRNEGECLALIVQIG